MSRCLGFFLSLFKVLGWGGEAAPQSLIPFNTDFKNGLIQVCKLNGTLLLRPDEGLLCLDLGTAMGARR